MEWQELEVTVPGGTLFCRAGGEGKPLLLIHGLGCDGSFFLRLGEVLAPHRRVIIYDRRGYGGSTCEAPAYGSRQAFGQLQATDAEAVLRAAGIGDAGPADVLAHSAGGVVSLFLAAHCPQLIDRVVAFEPAAFDLLDPDEPVLHDGEEAIATAQTSYLDAMVTFMRTMPPADDRAPVMAEEEARHFERDLKTSMTRDFEALFHPQGPLPTLPGDTDVPAPSIVFATGELSRGYYLAKSTERLAERYGCPVLRFPGSHNAPRDLPRSFAASLLGTFALMRS